MVAFWVEWCAVHTLRLTIKMVLRKGYSQMAISDLKLYIRCALASPLGSDYNVITLGRLGVGWKGV